MRHVSRSLSVIVTGSPQRGRISVVSEMLGHSSIGITADTCTSVLPEVARAAAEAAARLVPRMTSTDRRVPIWSPKGRWASFHEKESPGQTGCAARDSNPEPAD